MVQPLTAFRLGSRAAELVPLDPLVATADRLARLIGPKLMPAKADQLRRNLARVDPSSAEANTSLGFGSYGRYWAESFRLPKLSAAHVERRWSVEGYGFIEEIFASGRAPILVLPHLGAWEWAAAWLSRIMGVGVTAVVERLEPVEVYDWFVELRSSYGINVIPLGSGAMGELTAAVARQDVICLLADRDIGGNGLDVEFFGEQTSLPAGPAVLARRTGCPLLPTAVYHQGRHRVGLVTAPIEPGSGRGRAENVRLTRAVADRLQQLIAAAPEQWHLLEANWPADRPAAPATA